ADVDTASADQVVGAVYLIGNAAPGLAKISVNVA
ncbi:hypothetical protein LCGC14_2158170, partial [marine sediment metagenome]